MSKRNIQKEVSRAFIRQQDQADCGVACLASLVKYYGGEVSLESLRELSGTSTQGTTMLGLLEAAEKVGLDVEALEGDIANLKEFKTPSILHVVIDDTLHHYIVYYGYHDGAFLVSDPGRGVRKISEEEMEKIWVSRALLAVNPNESFKTSKGINREKWFWVRQLIKEDMNILGIALILGIGVSVLSLVTAVFSQRLIDDIIPNNYLLKLKVGLGLLLFLLIIKSGISYLRQFFLLRQSKDFNNRIIQYFYGALLHLPLSFFDNRKTGDLVARMNDTVRIQSALSYLTANLMIDILLAVTSVVFITLYSPVLGVLALVSVPLYFVIVYFFHKPILEGQRKVMGAYAKNESNYVDTIQGVDVIKASNKESLFTHITKKVYDFYQEQIFDLGKVRIKFTLVTEVAGTLLITAVIAVSSFNVLDETLKLGAMMAILQMIGMLIPSVGRLATTNIMLQEARVAFERMFEFTSIRPEDSEVRQEASFGEKLERLEVKNLSFRFPGRQELLKNISFYAQKGKMVSVLGESGCGKSTTLKILQRFYDFQQGSILVNGKDWTHIPTVDWRSMVAVVPQDIKIFNGNILYNIALSMEENEAEKVLSFCKEKGFDKFISQLPQSYATIVGEEGINLSGGQKQVIAMARALYKNPQLLLLDEATSAMDRNTEAWIMELVSGLRENMAVVLVTHRIKTASLADDIFLVEEGNVVQHGTHEELIKGENLYAEAWKDYDLVSPTTI